MLGEGSHLLKAIAKNTESLEKLLGEIQSWPGVMATKTTFVLSTIKETTVIRYQIINIIKGNYGKNKFPC